MFTDTRHTTLRKLIRNLGAIQVWARSPEGDKSPTKIGSSRVGIGIGEGLPDFLTNRDRDRGGLPDFLKFRGNSG